MDKETEKAIIEAAERYAKNAYGGLKHRYSSELVKEAKSRFEGFVSGSHFGIQLQKDKARVLEECLIRMLTSLHSIECATEIRTIKESLAQYRGSEGDQPGCVCGHQGKCPEDGPIAGDVPNGE